MESVTEFVTILNGIYPEHDFTLHCSKMEISFLDTSIIKLEDGSLEIDLYKQMTVWNGLLHYTSGHP